MTDVVSGLVKAVVFAAIIASVSCAQGLRAVNGAEDVGKAVRNSVVISFVMIIVFNYFITSFTRPLY
jgi:phospholipid/cholesterol/gamma-HCH transport system permease protein